MKTKIKKASKRLMSGYMVRTTQMRGGEFLARVNAAVTFFLSQKTENFDQKLDDEGFKERNLNDTRYVARFLCGFIEENMLLLGKGKKRVFASNGQITALLRHRWGLKKVREDNDRHHAVDAIVVACSTYSLQKKITDYVRYKEMNVFSGESIDREIGEVIALHFHNLGDISVKKWKFAF